MSSSEESSADYSEDESSKKRKLGKKKIVKKVVKRNESSSKRKKIEVSDNSSKSSDDGNSDDNSSSDSSDSESETEVKVENVSSIKRVSSTSSISVVKVQKQPKQLRKMERLEEARKAYKWWDAKELPEGINWLKLEHAGVVFAPNHVRHYVPLIYDSKRVELNAEQEELATFYAAIPEDGPQLGNVKTRSVFQKNFFEDFKETLPAGHVVQKFEKCDFSLIKKHLDTQKSLKKASTDEEKQQRKQIKEAQFLKHGYALIDGRMEKVLSIV